MRTKIISCAICIVLQSTLSMADGDNSKPVTPEKHSVGVVMNRAVQAGVSPVEAVNILKAGNARFTDGVGLSRDAKTAIAETAKGQYPLAVVVGCMDSRVPVEMVLDQGVGDIFVARVAGNVIDADMLGSLEYAAKAAGAKAIVVLGHSSCGAVKGACDEVKMGNLTTLLEKIHPVVLKTETQGERSSKNKDFVESVAKANVQHSVEQIRAQSPILYDMEQDGKIAIVGGMYDVDTGKVDWF